MERVEIAREALNRADWQSYNPSPGPLEIVSNIYFTFTKEWINRQSSNWWIVDFIADLRSHSALTWDDFWATFIVAAVFTVLRSQLTEHVFKPLAVRLKLRKADCRKAPESMFKVIYYLASFLYTSYIMFAMDRDYMGDPALFWEGWSRGMAVDTAVYRLYIMQLGFYLHAMYGVLVLDARRKDTFVMVLHHILTLLLIGFSLAARVHHIGVVVIFLHDIADVFLESGKLAMNLRDRGKTFHQAADHVSTFCFACFVLAWLVARLLVYVRAVLYVTGHVSMVVIPNGPFYLFFNFLLMSLYVMNVWWFQFIVMAATRILSGTVVKDTREDTTEEDTTNSESDVVPGPETETASMAAAAAADGDQDELSLNPLRRLVKIPPNEVPEEFANHADMSNSDKNFSDLPAGQSASQTANRRLRQRKS